MAVTWKVKSTSGLGPNYKSTVEWMANKHGYGSLYEATRGKDWGGNHCWDVKTKKWFGLKKYTFVVYTRYEPLHKTEDGAGYGPDVHSV